MEGKYKERVTLGLGEGDDIPLQCSCLENPMDGGAWWAAVHGVAESRTLLSNFTFTFHFHALENEIHPLHCSCLGSSRDGRAWWAAIHVVTQNRMRLKRLSCSSNPGSKERCDTLLPKITTYYSLIFTAPKYCFGSFF